MRLDNKSRNFHPSGTSQTLSNKVVRKLGSSNNCQRLVLVLTKFLCLPINNSICTWKDVDLFVVASNYKFKNTTFGIGSVISCLDFAMINTNK